MSLDAFDASALPAAVTTYFDARPAGRYDEAAAVFAPDAVVVDDGRTYDGMAEVRPWIERTSTEFTYTTTPIGQEVDGDRVVVLARIEGDFPGGVVDLFNRFTLREGVIERLVIEP